jgi:aryl-alcohol dehydrogenase-like predicted oxidoreductase
MLHRTRFEQEYFPVFQKPYNIGTTIWSPLASGVLTGKYNDGIPEDSRLNQPGYEFLKKKLEQQKQDGTLDKIKKLSEWSAEKLDASMTQLALAWCVKNKNVSTVLLGATKEEQLIENLGALALLERWKPEYMEEIETILGNKPEAYFGFGGQGWRGFHII